MFEKFVTKHHEELKKIALGVRLLSMDAILQAKSGHSGLPLGGAEMGTFLYFACMNYNPKHADWFDRDRFVLSAGHGSMLQYALLHFAEFGLSIDDLKAFRQLHSNTPGHPEYGDTRGVEYTTGPLGQGLASAVGLALAERMLAARMNSQSSPTPVVDHRTYVIAGDGCMMEGVTGEACSLAGHLKLSRLIVLYDANNITIDGTIDIAFTENVAKRFEAYGWNVFHADGNDFHSLAKAMDQAHANSCLPNGEGAPSLIVCKTVAGKGSPKWEGKPKIHGNPMSLDDVNAAKKHLGVDDLTPFFVPSNCYEAARSLLIQRTQKFHSSNMNAWETFASSFSNSVEFTEADWQGAKGKMATRVASGKALVALAQKCPYLVGGSADLAGSNNTTIPNSSFVNATDFSGRNIHFGVREHAMGAICNGLTVHGGLRAYCATFAVFSDYMRPALRMAALMKIPTIFIFTHDSFAVGEDGPTHQPVEHHLALRCIPNMNVYRPADVLETFAAWETVVQKTTSPSSLLLTRQDVEDLNELASSSTNDVSSHALATSSIAHFTALTAMRVGAYILKDFRKTAAAARVVLFASGSEVQIAYKTAFLLEDNALTNQTGETVSVRVVSVPNVSALLQNQETFNTLFPKDATLIGIEAGSKHNLSEICGRDGAVFGLNHFGLSAPYSTLSEVFGFTPKQFAMFVRTHLQLNAPASFVTDKRWNHSQCSHYL